METEYYTKFPILKFFLIMGAIFSAFALMMFVSDWASLNAGTVQKQSLVSVSGTVEFVGDGVGSIEIYIAESDKSYVLLSRYNGLLDFDNYNEVIKSGDKIEMLCSDEEINPSVYEIKLNGEYLFTYEKYLESRKEKLMSDFKVPIAFACLAGFFLFIAFIIFLVKRIKQ